MFTCSDCKNYHRKDEKHGKCWGNIVEANTLSTKCPQKSFQKRINEWLNKPYKVLYEKLKDKILPYLKNDRSDIELYTLHDDSHSENVEKMIKVIVTKGHIELSSLERFLLSFTSIAHDIGMNSKVYKMYSNEIRSFDKTIEIGTRRHEHHNASCWFLLNDLNIHDIENGKERLLSILRAVCIIIQFHRKSEDLKKCSEIISIKGEVVRIKLLAAIFRLADTLHKDITRFDPNIYAMLQIATFNRTSRLHWIKSFVVSNIHLNENEQTITVQLDLPDYNYFINKEIDKNKIERNWVDRIRNLEYIIQTDIEEDLVVVNRIFSMYGMPTYVNVKTDVNYIRGFNEKYYKDIDGVLNELDILFSPNTSKVIKRALDSLLLIANYNEDEDDRIVLSQFEQLKDYLAEIYKARPCHVGLGRIIEFLKKLKANDDVKDVKDVKIRLKLIIDEINEFNKKAEVEILNKVNSIIPESTKSIFVIGYSGTIFNLLNSLKERSKQISIYILECATKRRLGHSNLIEYNDGIHYANELGKINFEKIEIIPDLGFASILNSLKEKIDDRKLEKDYLTNKTLVLFGANGIDSETGDCGHTSGYLSVAIVANYKDFNVPVKVISNTFKFGKVGWSINAKRIGEWLVTQEKYTQELNQINVKIENYREDRIPFKLIKEIVTEVDIKKEVYSKENIIDEFNKATKVIDDEIDYIILNGKKSKVSQSNENPSGVSQIKNNLNDGNVESNVESNDEVINSNEMNMENKVS